MLQATATNVVSTDLCFVYSPQVYNLSLVNKSLNFYQVGVLLWEETKLTMFVYV